MENQVKVLNLNSCLRRLSYRSDLGQNRNSFSDASANRNHRSESYESSSVRMLHSLPVIRFPMNRTFVLKIRLVDRRQIYSESFRSGVNPTGIQFGIVHNIFEIAPFRIAQTLLAADFWSANSNLNDRNRDGFRDAPIIISADDYRITTDRPASILIPQIKPSAPRITTAVKSRTSEQTTLPN